jgi:hypothetical protein
MNYKINFYFSFIFSNFTFLKRESYERHFISKKYLWEKHLSTNRE